MKGLKIGYAICGSFCTVAESLKELSVLKNEGADLFPIMSDIVYNSDTRFTNHNELIKTVEEITGKPIIHTITAAEPIGPKNLLDAIVISPCTGNTLSKLANGITDTAVTMAVKGTLRNKKPVILALATNDALSGSAQNIGKLLNNKNIYFVPFKQDDFLNKPTSAICDFTLIKATLNSALEGRQNQPLLM